MVLWTTKNRTWAKLPCELCQAYRTRNGELIRDGAGKLIPTTSVPLCHRTPCGSREDKPRVRPEWTPFIERYYQWRLLGVLPRAGGLLDQNPIERVVFCAIRSAELREEADEVKRRALSASKP